MDDFDVILGNEFFIIAKAMPIPFLGGLMIMDESHPCFVRAVRFLPCQKKNKDGILLAMQLKHGLRKGDITYLATMREVKEKTIMYAPE